MSKLTKGYKSVENAISKVVPHTGEAEKRATMYAAREQMQYYHEQKEQLHKENEELSQKKTAEQNKINEKQIRALRRNFRSPGFMDSGNAGNAVSNQLG